MILADAYTGLGFLAARPEIDPRHVVLTGFSYGAMSTMYGLYAQFADKLAPPGLRFAGHVAFYGPCIARFDDSRTTGAPLLMLIGGKDELVDQSRVATIVYPDAVHQWDGALAPRLSGSNLSGCSLRVERDGTITDQDTGLEMSGAFRRKLILGLCTLGARPYPIARDDRVRAQATADYGRFLANIFAAPPRPAAQ
jgi:acetyl esterase/lipase